MSRVDSSVRWLCLVLVACSMGKDPAPRPPPTPAPGTITGRVTAELHGPGADDGRPPFTETSPLQCTVRAGSASAQTGSDGAYALLVPPGHVEVSFVDCAKNCCYDPASTTAVDVRSGSATLVNWSCECDAK